MTPAWWTARRVLAIRLDGLGDVLMTTPALRALKQGRPERRLTLLAAGAGAAAAPFIADVDQVIEFAAPWMKPAAAGPAADRELLARLAEERFDAAVIFTVYSQNPLPAAYLCYLAGIPLRLAHCRENPYHLLTDWLPESEPAQTVRHEVRRQLDLVAAVGCTTADERLAFAVPESARRRVAQWLSEQGLTGRRPLALIHPGASAPSRRYPPAAFAEVARRLHDAGYAVAFTGGEEEIGLVTAIRERMGAPSRSLAGALTLAELGAAIAAAAVLVTNNTGPAHIAAAVGAPVVVLYALTNPQHTPWSGASRVLFHDVPCKYCYRSVCPHGRQDCLTQVAPDAVVAAVQSLLAPRAERRSGIQQPA